LQKFAGHPQLPLPDSPSRHRPQTTYPEYRGPLIHAHHHPLDTGSSEAMNPYLPEFKALRDMAEKCLFAASVN
jgi:hypothetical protein